MNVAFIPVRGGSKSIPLKNIKLFNGYPLVYWVVKAAQECNYIDKVFVATDSEKISEVVNSFLFSKVETIGRSDESASDTASTESAMIEFAKKYFFDNIVLIQATSPMLTSEDLDRGMEYFLMEDVDSVLSAVRQKRFCWKEKDGFVTPLNYDYNARPRRQEFDGYLVENGAFYITSRELLLKSKCRLAGRIKAVEMREDTYYEIDEPNDWIIMEQLMKARSKQWDMDIMPDIKMFLTDSDGCLTDGGMYYSENGDELKKFNTKDGMAFRLLKEKGIITGIITGEDRELVKRRAEKLKMDICEMGVNDKLACIMKLCKKYNISLENVAYVGDDINDIDVIREVGLGCCVNDAQRSVKDVAKYVSNVCGGKGAIRDIVDMILKKY